MTATETQPAQPIGRDNSIPVPPADKNLSFVLRAVDDIVFEQRPVVPPASTQVQVNVRQVSTIYGIIRNPELKVFALSDRNMRIRLSLLETRFHR